MLNRLKTFDVGLWLLPLLLLWILLAAQPLGAKITSGQNSGVVGVSGRVTLLEAAPRLGFGGLGSESASGAPHAAKRGVGDLTRKEISQIQSVVNEAGRPLEVVGSAAKGTRRGVGTELPLGKGSGTRFAWSVC